MFKFRESQVLTEEQQEFVKNTTENIYKLLADIRPGGRKVAKAVKHIIKVSFMH
jgi:hypothetical protein